VDLPDPLGPSIATTTRREGCSGVGDCTARG
jgi:hypothetical protein